MTSNIQDNCMGFLPLAEVPYFFKPNFPQKYVTIVQCQLYKFRLNSLSHFMICIITIFSDSPNKLLLDKHRSKRQIEVRVFLPSCAP